MYKVEELKEQGWINNWMRVEISVFRICVQVFWNVKHQTNIRQHKTTNMSLRRFKVVRTHQFHRLCEAFWTCDDNKSVQVPVSQIGEIMPPAGNQKHKLAP